MNQRFITFLTVAEAGSFFGAAQQLFVSYQCVSAHVRSLEEEYGVKLVEHRPRFALTAEGQALLETLKKIRALEEGIAAELDGSGPEAKGHVTLGVPSARYTEIVPRIVPPFKKEYPHVELEVAYDYSNLLQNQVERGILDMAIVTQYSPRPQLNASVLLRDTYLFILSDRLLQVCVGSRAQEVDALYKQNGITLEQMTQFPIVTYPVGSRLRSVMDEYTAQTGRKFHTVFASNRTEVLDALETLRCAEEKLMVVLEDACGRCDSVCEAQALPTDSAEKEVLQKIPELLLHGLRGRGLCLRQLARHLGKGDTVYEV